MSRIVCEHCKTTIEACPDCGEDFEHNLLVPILVLAVCMTIAGITFYNWQQTLEKHEEAMQIRKAYIRNNPEIRKLPALMK
jgi:uncharacterized protein involved in tolerance to divalent cations